MNISNQENRNTERGSVLMWIFIAVALFGALSFTVAKIGSGGNTQMTERARIFATDLIQYAAAIQRSVRVMRIDGVDESELCFHTANWGHTDYEFNPPCATLSNRVFDSTGGSVRFQTTTAQWYDKDASPANDANEWVFTSSYEITDVGITANADLIMATAPVRLDICEQINLLAGYSSETPPTVANGTYNTMATNEFTGTYAGGNVLASIGRERCVGESNGGGIDHYIYYKVILAR